VFTGLNSLKESNPLHLSHQFLQVKFTSKCVSFYVLPPECFKGHMLQSIWYSERHKSPTYIYLHTFRWKHLPFFIIIIYSLFLLFFFFSTQHPILYKSNLWDNSNTSLLFQITFSNCFLKSPFKIAFSNVIIICHYHMSFPLGTLPNHTISHMTSNEN
jgi:hypothetical protein